MVMTTKTTNHPFTLLPPPADLANRQLPIRSFNNNLIRVHKTGRKPIFASHIEGRFSNSSLPFGVCYTSDTLLGAFAESCLYFIAETQTFAASATFVFSRAYTTINVKAPLNFVDLTSPNLVSIGTTALICSTTEYSITQQWASALHNHPISADGIFYLTNYVGSQHSIAIFERAFHKLVPQSPILFSDKHQILNDLLLQLKVSII